MTQRRRAPDDSTPPLDPVIFLDIDGVLNRHNFCADAQSNTLHFWCVWAFNSILKEVPSAKIVVSSAWRYMIAPEAMTLKGFEYLLRTHLVACKDRVIGVTPRDEEIKERGDQIRHWLNENGGNRNYVVLDDGGEKDGEWHGMGIAEAGHPVVWTESKKGLTFDKAVMAAALLKGP